VTFLSKILDAIVDKYKVRRKRCELTRAAKATQAANVDDTCPIPSRVIQG
jgi:hypothetical protein